MDFFAEISSLFKMSSPSPPPDPIPAALRPGHLARRPRSVWYTEFTNFSSEDHVSLAAFTLVSTLHGEHTGKLGRAGGLAFVFQREDSVVYLRVDRMLFVRKRPLDLCACGLSGLLEISCALFEEDQVNLLTMDWSFHSVGL
jgi:hypothetical protein